MEEKSVRRNGNMTKSVTLPGRLSSGRKKLTGERDGGQKGNEPLMLHSASGWVRDEQIRRGDDKVNIKMK